MTANARCPKHQDNPYPVRCYDCDAEAALEAADDALTTQVGNGMWVFTERDNEPPLVLTSIEFDERASRLAAELITAPDPQSTRKLLFDLHGEHNSSQYSAAIIRAAVSGWLGWLLEECNTILIPQALKNFTAAATVYRVLRPNTPAPATPEGTT